MSWFRYRYSLLRPLVQWKGTLIAHLDDLAAMKLNAIYDRSSGQLAQGGGRANACLAARHPAGRH
jgi:hypothetical protein